MSAKKNLALLKKGGLSSLDTTDVSLSKVAKLKYAKISSSVNTTIS